MATHKCLACGHDNNVGDEWCTSCSSSLNLQLCSTCEAINASSAERCHSCGAPFDLQAEVMAPAGENWAREAPPTGRALAATWVIPGKPATARRISFRAATWMFPFLAAAGLTYYLYGTTQPRPMQTQAAQPSPAPSPAEAQIVELKQAPAVPVKASAAALAPSAPAAFEPKQAAMQVTHTRTAVSAPPAVAAPLEKALPATLNAVPRVTHTRGVVTQVAEVGEDPAAAAVGASVPGESRSEAVKGPSAACAPSVAALGLCSSR